jgi:hypothetical protein
MCGVRREETKQAKYANMGSQQHTYLGNKGTYPAAHGRQRADHSLAAEMERIRMHVWGRAKENKAGWSEGHSQHGQPSTLGREDS